MSALLRLRDYQTKAITAIHEKWDAGQTRIAVVLPTGAGKGSTLSTEVPTPSGLRVWGDLQVGDEVFGSDGQPTEVTAIYDRGVIPAYRVTFSDGASVDVDGEHLWVIRDAQYRKTSRERRVVQTQTIAASNLKMDRGYRWHIPMASAVDRKPADLPIDPYVVGALIANGGLAHDGTALTTPDQEVASRVAAATPTRKSTSVGPGICDRYYLRGLVPSTRALGMRVKSGQKRIPRTYLEGSIEQRIDLLHGLMDGDGSARDKARRSVNYSTTSLGLAEDVQELVTSLGGTANLKRFDRGEKGIEYSLGIVLPSSVPAFWSSRKAHAGTQSIRDLQPRRAIVSVEPIGDMPIRCITVAAKDSLYLITRHHIVTHNTVVFTHLAEQYLRDNPGKRVLVLAHTDELVLQAASKMKQVAPDRTVGIVKAAQDETHAEVVVASVQSLRSKTRRDRIRNVGLIVCDEAHHGVARTYRTIFEHFGALPPQGWAPGTDPMLDNGGFGTHEAEQWEPTSRLAGFTATLVRSDKEKLSDVWEDVAFRLSIAFMIRAGYLLDVKGKRVEVPKLDLKKVKTSGGDYAEGALGDALVEAMAPEIVAKAYLEHASDRKGIGFAPTVESAYVFSDAFAALGIVSEVVHGALARDERRAILARLKTGETQVVWSVMALTEGFDEPTVSCAIMARPTKSNGLWQQMCGRVLRPDLSLPPDKRGHALLLDVTGVSRLHGLQSLVDLSTRDDLPENVDEDLSLLELEDLLLEDQEPEGVGGSEPTVYYVGPAETREFDPLGADSKRTWARTPDGHFYLQAGTAGYIFLCDSLQGESGSYDVVWAAKEEAGGARMTGHNELHFEMAVAWGEEEATERGGFGTLTLTSKRAKWRKEACTSGQAYRVRRTGVKVEEKYFATRLGAGPDRIEFWVDGELLTKGKAAEIIDAHEAAQRIDPLVRAVRAHVNNEGK